MSERADTRLKMPSRHLYDVDEPEPPFEPPVPLRHNHSVPDDIGKWRREGNNKRLFTGSLECHRSQPNAELDAAGESISPTSNPTFYPSLRFHRTDPSAIGKGDLGVIDGTLFKASPGNGSATSLDEATSSRNRLSDMVARRGLTITQLEINPGTSAMHSASVPSSADPSLKSELSPRFFAGVLSGSRFFDMLGNSMNKKVEVSNFDISAVAPTSM